jgi:hypothetical protein
MNSEEATTLLRQELTKYGRKTYAELRLLVDARLPTLAVMGPSRTEYQVAIHVYSDGAAGGGIRVIGSIDDGGWRAFVPLSESFIAGPNDDPAMWSQES